MTLPYIKMINQYRGVSSAELDQVLREGLSTSRRCPVYLELAGHDADHYLLFRAGQIYAAGKCRNGQFTETTIKEFLLSASNTGSARIVAYEVDNKILHSLLLLFQKKPALQVSTSLVDLDQVLDKIEEERKSCIVAATQDEFLSILRYEKGKVAALCHGQSAPGTQERSLREDFLVKIYTLSAKKPVSIGVYEDLLVKYASDARTIDANYGGRISDIFVSKPPVVTLVFKDKEIGHWVLDKPVFRIGRTPDNDIVIDNLAVSRIHSVIEEEKGKYYIRDCDSLNGTVVNGRRVGRALLQEGDEIQIGKHTVLFQKPGGKQIALGPVPEGFDQTMVFRKENPAPSPEPREPVKPGPRLVEKNEAGDHVFEIGDSSLTMGRDEDADVAMGGLFVAKRHAEIARVDGHYVIRHVGGRCKVIVEGIPVKEWVLRNNDCIKIGKRVFVFEE